MFESIKAVQFVDDGCNYMSDEEVRAFSEMAAPTVFDSSWISNKILDVSYGTLPQHLLDIYKPETGDGPFPLIFYVHGGGWMQGTKTEGFLGSIIDAINYGYAVASIDYRLAPATTFPEFLFDVKTAIRWARANAQKYSFDPERIAMIGDSAGAHLTLMAGFTAGHPEYAGEKYGWADRSDALQVICNMYAPAILADPEVPYYLESGVKRAMRDIVGQNNFYDLSFGTKNKNLLNLISPISYVHKDIPPTLILHGRQDGIVPYQHSQLLYDKIVNVCGEGKAKLLLYEDRNHGDFGFNTKENCRVVLEFFDKYLK